MAKRGSVANPTLGNAHEAAARVIAEHESSIKALKREVETAAHQTPETRRHLYHMIAKHHEGLAKEYKALAKAQG